MIVDILVAIIAALIPLAFVVGDNVFPRLRRARPPTYVIRHWRWI